MRDWWCGVGMKTFVIVAGFALFAANGPAAGLLRWETPDGGLYFGDTPPEGSRLVGEAEKLGTVGDGWVPKPPAAATEEAAPTAATGDAVAPEPVDAEPVAAQVPGGAREVQPTWKRAHEALMGQPPP